MWFGWSLTAWESVFFWVTSAAAVLGGIGLMAAFSSAIIGYKISDVVTRDANIRINEARAVASTAEKRAAEANQKAESERLARVQLEAKIAPRSMTQAEQNE